jgi:ATP-dependent protease HslVU (ClpYQ) peptidase subunit
MTTIATDGKSMASDGNSTINNTIISGTTSKIRLLPDGSIFGASGDACQGDVLFDWLAADPDTRGEYPQLKEVWALVLAPDGKVTAWDDMSAGRGCMVNAPIATGSGERYAMGAMDAGAGPVEAVMIAAKRDPFTGGEITVCHIDQALP